MNSISEPIKKSYSRLEEDENEGLEDDPDDESDDNAPAGAASVFRTNQSWDGEHDDQDDDTPDTPGSQSLMNGSYHRESTSNNINNSLEHRSTTHSFEMDDDDWDEDEASLRRYNLDFKTEIPRDFQPAEFESFPKRLYLNFLNLRTAARQRQAARLLSMPSEAFLYKCHSFCMTMCDATDQGIMLVAACLSVWLLIGFVAPVSPMYWLTGITAFLIRVSARRILEYLQGNRFRQHRLRLSSIELGGGSESSYRKAGTRNETNAQEIV